jgi:tRNA threonylcarbamoyladenosine biosynthesis protein TsaB
MAAMLSVLALDTATPSPSVAVLSDRGLFEESLSADRRASEELLPSIARALEGAGLRLADLDRIAVCAGPGSFTGVRVGLATAWSFGRALGVPVEAVSTLEAMAETARRPGVASAAALLDAGRGEIVGERFDLSSPRARSLGSAERLRARDLPPAWSAGPLVALPADLVPGVSAPPSSVAECLARAVARAPRPGTELAAIYSRPSAAEERHGAL